MKVTYTYTQKELAALAGVELKPGSAIKIISLGPVKQDFEMLPGETLTIEIESSPSTYTIPVSVAEVSA